MRGDALQSELTIGLADELNVAPLGVGAWAWGTTRLWGYGKEYDRSDVGRAFRASMAEGVTLVDTAEMYGNGASERIIGEILREGGFGYVRPLVTVDEDFARRAHDGRKPEKRFRFSQPCVEGNCHHWTGSRCGVIDRALQVAEEAKAIDASDEALPKCTIRRRCRWFAQAGRKACAVCPLVITDVSPD